MVLRKQRLGDILVEAKVISLSQLNIALERMKFSRIRLGEQLVKLRICTENSIVEALSKQLRIPIVDLDTVEVDPEVFSILPRSLALESNCIPFKVEGTSLSVAFSDPLKLDKIQNLEARTQRMIRKFITTQSAIDRAIEKHYITDDSAQTIMDTLESSTESLPKLSMEDLTSNIEMLTSTEESRDDSALELKRKAEDKGVVATVNQLIIYAIQNGASDIHFEPQRKFLLVRQRIDGILIEMARPPKSAVPAIVSRIKILAHLDITEKRIPQDGKVRATMAGRQVDLRVSTIPTKYGEKVVIRILDQSKGALSLEKLFFEPKQLQNVNSIIHSSQGMILVTGPTGSGKTTTLYAIISTLYSPKTNIVTIEDPIEYELEGVNQVQVNHRIGLSFAKILRSILRQDPEIVLVGEIRDQETAGVAFQASQTGHLVLSTLHTNSTYATVARLLEVGVEPQVIASSVQGILAQRLVRQICPECREEYEPDELTSVQYNLPAGASLFRGLGCEKCNFIGYKGRLSVVEIMTMTPELRAAIGDGKPEHIIKKVAVRGGMELMFDIGKRYALNGLTTIDEIARVLETVDDSFADSDVPDAQLASAQSSDGNFAASGKSDGNCPSCNEPIKDAWKACPFCGVKIEKAGPPKCQSCGEELKPNWKACPFCGTSQDGQSKEAGQRTSERMISVANGSGKPIIEGKPRVLVVDDQKSMQKLVTIALQGISCDVATADDGVQALEEVQRYKPHLIVLDIVMPRMDGLEVCRRLRSDVRTAFIPIMMLTSLSDEKNRLKGYVAGTDDYLAKPFVLEEFYSRIRNLLRRTYGFFATDDDLLGVGKEWDSATEEARTRQKFEDRASMKEKLMNAQPSLEAPEEPEAEDDTQVTIKDDDGGMNIPFLEDK